MLFVCGMAWCVCVMFVGVRRVKVLFVLADTLAWLTFLHIICSHSCIDGF